MLQCSLHSFIAFVSFTFTNIMMLDKGVNELVYFDCSARDMSGGRQSTESSKRIRATPPSPISRNVGSQSSLTGGLGFTLGGPPSHLSASGTSTTAAVARYVDDDVNFLRDLREINRVERDQIDRDTPIDARIHSTISNGRPAARGFLKT